MRGRGRAARRADFRRRAGHDPEGVRRHPTRRWRYIAVHPCADERDLLTALRLRPSQCIKVDCYWDTGHDVVFLQVYGPRATAGNRGPGVYARYADQWGRLDLQVVISKASVRTAEIHEAMAEVERRGLLDLRRRRYLRRGQRGLRPV